jgi:transcriptional regulator with XRE-family HTH domain
MKRFGKRCKELRAASEMTQQQAAEKAGLAISHLQLIERAGSNPTLASVAALSRAYGVTLVEMFEGV